MVEAWANPPRTDVRQPGTWITRSPDWLEYFGLALSVHHAATNEPLVLTSFETAFRNACESVGWNSGPPASPTQRFIDLIVQSGTGPARRLSLKSTAARNLNESTAHISKLTEAAWIQDQRKPQDRRRKILEIFRDYAEAVDSIVLLRAFRLGTSIPFRYQLLEIPTSIFASIQELPMADFQRDAPGLACRQGETVIAKVAIDRSDAKITVRSIRLEACIVHAEWVNGQASTSDPVDIAN